MTDALTGDALHPQPVAIDLSGIETTHPEKETPEQLLSTTVAETAAGVTGVHHLGGLAARSLDRASRRVLGTSTVPGVTVSRVDGRTVVDLDLVVEYPHTIAEVIEKTRSQVSRAAAQLVKEPVEVNVNVTDIHGPFDRVEPAPSDQPPLVDQASAAASSLAGKASDAAGEVSARVSDAAAEVSARASDAAAEVSSRVSDAVDAAKAGSSAEPDSAAAATDGHDTAAVDSAADTAAVADTDADETFGATSITSPEIVIIEAPETVLIDAPTDGGFRPTGEPHDDDRS